MIFTFSCLVLCCGKLGTLLCQYFAVKSHRELDIGEGFNGAVPRGLWIFTSEEVVSCGICLMCCIVLW